MNTWTFFDAATGAPLGRTYTGSVDHLAANTPPGAVALEGCYDIADGCLVDGAFIPYTDAERARYLARPGVRWTWDVQTRTWADGRTLDEARAEAWARIKAARTAALDGGFLHDGRAYDSDPDSRANIAGAAQGAAIAQAAGAPWSVTWTLADNTAAALDAAQTVALGLACLAHVDAAHAHARMRRAQIEAAANNDECDAIAW